MEFYANYGFLSRLAKEVVVLVCRTKSVSKIYIRLAYYDFFKKTKKQTRSHTIFEN